MPAVPISVSRLDEIESSFTSGTISNDDIRLLISTCRAFLGSEPNCNGIEPTWIASTPNSSRGRIRTNGPVRIFCDGACSGNPGPGGWSAIIIVDGIPKELRGGDRYSTNNKMEMNAAIRALETLEQPTVVTVTTDSRYVVDGITKWIFNWKKNGWKSADKKPVKNQDLWLRLDELNRRHKITWEWTRGHSGHPENDRCDELARLAIAEIQ